MQTDIGGWLCVCAPVKIGRGTDMGGTLSFCTWPSLSSPASPSKHDRTGRQGQWQEGKGWGVAGILSAGTFQTLIVLITPCASRLRLHLAGGRVACKLAVLEEAYTLSAAVHACAVALLLTRPCLLLPPSLSSFSCHSTSCASAFWKTPQPAPAATTALMPCERLLLLCGHSPSRAGIHLCILTLCQQQHYPLYISIS